MANKEQESDYTGFLSESELTDHFVYDLSKNFPQLIYWINWMLNSYYLFIYIDK